MLFSRSNFVNGDRKLDSIKVKFILKLLIVVMSFGFILARDLMKRCEDCCLTSLEVGCNLNLSAGYTQSCSSPYEGFHPTPNRFLLFGRWLGNSSLFGLLVKAELQVRDHLLLSCIDYESLVQQLDILHWVWVSLLLLQK